MKIKSLSKRIVALLLTTATILLLSACGGETITDASGQISDTSSSNTESDAPKDTEVALLDTDILISGEKSFRIVYADGYRSAALEI